MLTERQRIEEELAEPAQQIAQRWEMLGVQALGDCGRREFSSWLIRNDERRY